MLKRRDIGIDNVEAIVDDGKPRIKWEGHDEGLGWVLYFVTEDDTVAVHFVGDPGDVAAARSEAAHWLNEQGLG